MVTTRSRRARSESKEVDDAKKSVEGETESAPVIEKEKSAPSASEEEQGQPKADGSDGGDDSGSDPGGEPEQSEKVVQAKVGQMFSRRKRNEKGKSKEKNALTKLIPGYTAPMKLNTSSLDRYRPSGGITALQRRAERSDASTKTFVVDAKKNHSANMQKKSNGSLPSSYSAAYSSFKTGKKRAPDTSAGRGWFGMAPSEMTQELKTDLAIIRNRAYLSNNKFYKSADKHHKIVQVGTVIEGAAEYYSSRLTKKQRRSNITDEILADPDTSTWAKNKFKKMAREQTEKFQKRTHKAKRGKRSFA